MARVLIVGCGCRGQSLARALAADGHALRGTTRDEGRLAAIEESGAEPVLADPDRLGTIMAALTGVSAVCWLMGSAVDAPGVHGDRLATLMERLVDTPVRGLVYEASGAADGSQLERGAEIVRDAAETWRIPVEIVDAAPHPHEVWLAAMRAAAGGLLSA